MAVKKKGKRRDPGLSAELTRDITSDDNVRENRMVKAGDVANTKDDDGEHATRARADAFIKQCLSWWNISEEATRPQRMRSMEEVRFNSGQHWDEDMQKAREDDDKVVIQINRTPQYLNQVANEFRMARPSIIIKPAGNGATEYVATIKQGLIRSCQQKSGAEGIRDDKFYGVLEKGWAVWRVNVEHQSPRSFKRVLRTGTIDNDFSAYWDPAATKYDKSDGMFWIITDDMPADTYKTEYPHSKLASLTEFKGIGDVPRDWISDGIFRVAEVFYKERKKEKLYALADDITGDGKFEDELQRDADGKFIGVAYVAIDDNGGEEPLWRWSYRDRVYWAKINAVEVLSGNDDKTGGREFVEGATKIPIIFASGRRVMAKDRMVYCGMVRDAIEPCLAADYWLSAITEMVGLGPKSPWIVAYEAISKYKDMWDSANIKNYSALYYDHVDENGETIPAPTRNFGEPPIQAMTFILNFADEDIKRVMGIYNAGLGAPGPETSGVAIDSRKSESDVANYNYIDNFKRSINYEAEVYLDYMRVYDQKQVVQIVKPNNKNEEAVINATFRDPKSGKMVDTTMDVGDYDTVTEVGATMQTRREETARLITDYLKIYPEAAPYVGDILMRNLDGPDKDELEKRLRHLVPPDALESEDSGDEVPPQFMAQYKATTQMLEQVTQQMNMLAEQVKSKADEYAHEERLKVLELASQERQAAVKAEVAMATLASKGDIEMLKIEFQKVQAEIERLNNPPEPPAPKEPSSQSAAA